MQANSVNFLRDILNNGRNFYIPVYQRNYSWEEPQCKQLVKDIMKLYNNEYNEHFIGTVVWKADDGNSDQLSVIDGQQRLTTMFLFVLAMKNNCDNEALVDELERIIANKFTKQNRLVPIKSDNEVFIEIINNRIDSVQKKSNRIYANYHYFDNFIKNNNLDIIKLYESIGKLSSIKMELHQNDNPQIIFESINSTGMSLSIADLIRNFLLMNESYETQTRLFENYWYQFENQLGIDNLVAFFEHYLSIHITERAINRNNMYVYFKKYFIDNGFTAETLLCHVKPYIDVYAYLCNKNNSELANVKSIEKLNKYRNDIIELENRTAYMFLMPTILEFKNEKINEEELIYSFELVLSYIFRRGLIGLATNVLQGIFRRLHKQVLENAGKYGWKNALDYALVTSKASSTAMFPTNEMFFASLHTRNLYGKYRYTDYLLLSLENDGNKTKFDMESFSIEHIMPQTPTKYWREALGENWKELYEEYVNDLGNLTLTSYNSELSNSDYASKKDILVNERHIKLNDYFIDVNKWNHIEIEKRGKKLANMALEIWKYPEVDNTIHNQVQEEKYNSVALNELVDDYFSIKPAKIEFENQTFNVKTIKESFETVLEYYVNENSEIFELNFVDSDKYSRKNNGIKYYVFSREEDKVFDPKKVKDFYYDKNRSGSSLFSLLNEILQTYDVNTEDVIIKYYK